MSRPIIEIRQLSKLYHVGAINYRTLREALAIWWARKRNHPIRYKNARSFDPIQAGPYPNTFWALHEVSATVQRGEILGIVGRNGAGKSTLLKILSRITEPTSGEALLRGRAGSLLEVGAGFHPELNGRENIFLNGAIIGMKRREIENKLDEIIAFAEVGAFIDTPVKRYSSGMYVRLAFAVAAHLEPDILIVDEVLAVGDARFQKKCLGKMEEVSTAHGRTVIFVSHNLEAVQRLCTHCLLLDRGRVAAYGETQSIITRYLEENLPAGGPGRWIDVTQVPREGTGQARFFAVRYSSGNAAAAGQPYSDGPLEFELAIEARAPTQIQSIAVALLDEMGRQLVNTDLGALGQTFPFAPGQTIVRLRVEQLHLKPGTYNLALWLARYAGERVGGNDIFDSVAKAFSVEVIDAAPEPSRISVGPTGPVTCRFKLIDISHKVPSRAVAEYT